MMDVKSFSSSSHDNGAEKRREYEKGSFGLNHVSLCETGFEV